VVDRPSHTLSGAVVRPRANIAHAMRSFEVGPCPSAGGNSGHASSAWVPLSSLRTPSWPSAWMTPSCKRTVVLSRAPLTTATVPGQPARHSARCGGSPWSGPSCVSPSTAGPATPAACPLASHCLAKHPWPTDARGPSARVAPWRAASLTTPRRHGLRAHSSWRLLAARPPRPSDATSPPTSMWSGASYAPPNSLKRRPNASKANAGHRAKEAT
jgi:hypothetical protein